MTRAMKLAALAAAVTALTVGPGCGVFDEFTDDDAHTASYRREGPPPTPSAGVQQPAEIGPAPATPGIHPAGKQ